MNILGSSKVASGLRKTLLHATPGPVRTLEKGVFFEQTLYLHGCFSKSAFQIAIETRNTQRGHTEGISLLVP